MTCDIIIPHYGVGELTQLCLNCLRSIRENTEDYRVILIDNASEDFDPINEELSRHNHLLIRNTKNLGFVKAVNQGVRQSTAQKIVILNNDTEVCPQWIEKLADGFRVAQNIGIVGPLMRVDKDSSDPVFEVSKPSWQSVWQIRNGGGPFIVPKTAMVAFFCVMLSRKCVDDVGLLDEDFGVGFGDDDMYCHQAHQAGWDIVLQQDLEIMHHHRSTFRKIYEPWQIKTMQREAMLRFRRKSMES